MSKCRCGNELHPVRLSLGYKTCVSCSTEQRWGAVQVVYHKTGNTVEIVKDPEVAAQMNEMSKRTGFGVMKGLTGNHRKNRASQPREVKIVPVKPVASRELFRRPMPSDWTNVGTEAASLYEMHGIDRAMEHINQAFAERRIIKADLERLTQIINTFAENNG